MTTTHFIWLGCGLAEMAIGALLMVGLIVSVYDADAVLVRFFGLDASKLGPSRGGFWYPTIAGNSFAQAAVAFGMHAYADLANGWEQVNLALDMSPKRVPLPKTVTLWNSTRFVISFLWLLKLVDGMVFVHGTDFLGWPAPALVRSIVFIDSIYSGVHYILPGFYSAGLVGDSGTRCHCPSPRGRVLPAAIGRRHPSPGEHGGNFVHHHLCISTFWLSILISVGCGRFTNGMALP